jgi:predicted transcriptional regulator
MTKSTKLGAKLDKAVREERQRLEDERRWSRYDKTGHFVTDEKAMAWLDDLVRGKRRPAPR